MCCICKRYDVSASLKKGVGMPQVWRLYLHKRDSLPAGSHCRLGTSLRNRYSTCWLFLLDIFHFVEEISRTISSLGKQMRNNKIPSVIFYLQDVAAVEEQYFTLRSKIKLELSFGAVFRGVDSRHSSLCPSADGKRSPNLGQWYIKAEKTTTAYCEACLRQRLRWNWVRGCSRDGVQQAQRWIKRKWVLLVDLS